ncbi:MAG: FAD-binding oxidoreductase [Calditrichae bacterium]|nr:FAD-binding oxidoreductase [Calditrichia bacterium]
MPDTPHLTAVNQKITELSTRMEGEVRLDRLTRALYSTDASSYQIEPLGACFPANVSDVQAVVRFAAESGLSIVPRGGGSSLSGQGIGEGLIMDLTPHLNRILEINPAEKWARVEAGVTLDQLNRALAPHGLMVGPDPSSAVVATIGGMTANNSTGSHSILYGMMADHLRELEVVLSDGTAVSLRPQLPEAVSALAARDTLEGRLYRDIPRLLARYAAAIERDYPRTWRNVAGYNLNRLHAAQQAGEPFSLVPLIAGSEGTLAAITTVTVGLVPRPAHTHLTLLHFPGLREALNCVPQLLAHQPGAVELLDKFFIDLTRENRQYRQRLSFPQGRSRGGADRGICRQRSGTVARTGGSAAGGCAPQRFLRHRGDL